MGLFRRCAFSFLAGTFDQRYPTFSPDGRSSRISQASLMTRTSTSNPFLGLVLERRFQAKVVAGRPGGDRADTSSITPVARK